MNPAWNSHCLGGKEIKWKISFTAAVYRNGYTYVYMISVVLSYLMELMGMLKTRWFDSAGIEAEPFPPAGSNLFP